jgi:hypothetical protein
MTLLALWALKQLYEEKEGEWQMIARKGKGYLKTLGISRVDLLYKKIHIA